MKRFLKKTALFIIITGSIMVLLLLHQDPEFIVGRKKIYMEKNADKNYDLLVLGSSRAMYTFNPTVYTGNKRLFNMGEEGQGFPSNYLMMKMLVEKHQLNIHSLLLQVDEFSFDGTVGFSRKFRDDFFVTDIDDPEVYEAFKKYRGAGFASTLKFFPKSANLIYCDLPHFIKYQLFSMKRFIPRLNKIYEKHLNEVVKEKGYKSVKANKEVPIMRQHLIIESDDRYYFEKLVSFCQSHNIRLYFYRAPVLACETVNGKAFEQYMDSFTRANNIPFYDYKCQYQQPGEYYDQNHPARKISTEVTKDLLRKLGLLEGEQ